MGNETTLEYISGAPQPTLLKKGIRLTWLSVHITSPEWLRVFSDIFFLCCFIKTQPILTVFFLLTLRNNLSVHLLKPRKLHKLWVKQPCSALKLFAYLLTTAQVFLRRYTALDWRAERMALKEEKFFSCLHSYRSNTQGFVMLCWEWLHSTVSVTWNYFRPWPVQ